MTLEQDRPPGPGEPTPVPGGQIGCAAGLARGLGRLVGETAVELVGGAVLGVLATASLAAVLVGVQLAYRHSPPATLTAAGLTLPGLLYGGRQLLRPERPRTRRSRIAAGVTGGLGLWLVICVAYASV
ncbi:hypothetical protein OG871_30235 [Kitasatospora sp. NBC_00374]|uniref:hypothetical protein n=1 Tax=Kitasatospora sp. NBC_00374 TaxID=2975964 RepID=UPI0032509C96